MIPKCGLVKMCLSYLPDKLMYESMLRAHQLSMKKPTLTSQCAQLSLLKKMFEKSQSTQQINETALYLAQLRHYRLLSVQSLNLIEFWVQTNWSSLLLFNQLVSSCFLVEQARYAQFRKYSDRQPETRCSTDNNVLMSMIATYCSAIVGNDITNHRPALLGLKDQLRHCKNANESNQKWSKEIDLILKAANVFDAISSPNWGSAFDIRHSPNRRSNLEIQVEALLTASGYKFHREVNLFGFTVDFLIEPDVGNPTLGSCVVEVMGSHHYTVDQKVFGKDIFRALTLGEIFPVRIVHASEINSLKGTQERLQYIKKIVEGSWQNPAGYWSPRAD